MSSISDLKWRQQWWLYFICSNWLCSQQPTAEAFQMDPVHRFLTWTYFYVPKVKESTKLFLLTQHYVLCCVDRATRYNCVKKNQFDAQLILSIFRQPLNVSGVSSSIIRRYNSMYTAIGTYSFQMTVCCPGWIRNPTRTTV